MKVLQIYKTYFPDTLGGVEQVIKTIASETEKLGARHSLLCVGAHANHDHIFGLDVIRFKQNYVLASCPFSVSFFTQFKKIACQYDLLHFHYPWPFADFTMLLRYVDRPSLVTFHADALKNSFLRQIYLPFQKAFFKKVDRIIPTSTPLLETSPDLQNYRSKCSVIPIGINKDFYTEPGSDTLAFWQNKFGQGFVLFVGVLRHYKGLYTLLEAARSVSLPIVIAGRGPLETELKEYAQNAGLNHVHFLGQISDQDKMALYTLCGMVVLPSHARAEAFGVTLLEGMVYKKPLISTELGTGTTYVNQHNKTGLVVKPGEVDELAAAIHTLQEPGLAKKMGETGYAWFLAEFQSAIMGQRYFDVYQGLMQK